MPGTNADDGGLRRLPVAPENCPGAEPPPQKCHAVNRLSANPSTRTLPLALGQYGQPNWLQPMTVAIAHHADGRAILDAVREVRPPFSPEAVVSEFAVLLKLYGIGTVRATATRASGRASGFTSKASATRRRSGRRASCMRGCCRQSAAVASSCSTIPASWGNSAAWSAGRHGAAAMPSTTDRMAAMTSPTPLRARSCLARSLGGSPRSGRG